MCLLMFNLLYWTKKKTNLIELKSMFQTHQKEVKLVKIFSTGDLRAMQMQEGWKIAYNKKKIGLDLRNCFKKNRR